MTKVRRQVANEWPYLLGCLTSGAEQFRSGGGDFSRDWPLDCKVNKGEVIIKYRSLLI
jgi:hypothetical protein